MQDWVIFLLGLVFAVPIGVLGNLVTPAVKSYIDKSSLSSKKKRLETPLKSLRKNTREGTLQNNKHCFYKCFKMCTTFLPMR